MALLNEGIQHEADITALRAQGFDIPLNFLIRVLLEGSVDVRVNRWYCEIQFDKPTDPPLLVQTPELVGRIPSFEL
eukprot:2798476-Karenia_brevis.AAC.1